MIFSGFCRKYLQISNIFRNFAGGNEKDTSVISYSISKVQELWIKLSIG